MKLRFTIISLILWTSLYSSVSLATVPVIDYTAIAKMIEQMKMLKKQYEKLSEIRKKATIQINKTQHLVDNTSGHYGAGNLFNSDSDLKKRRWSPKTWDDALKGLSGGNHDRYKQLVNQYKKKHRSLSKEEYSKGKSKDSFNSYQDSIEANRAASVNSSYEFEEIDKHMEKIHELSMEIEKTKNSKAAQDLMARLQVEQLYLTVGVTRQITLLNKQISTMQANIIDEETLTAKYNRLPKES